MDIDPARQGQPKKKEVLLLTERVILILGLFDLCYGDVLLPNPDVQMLRVMLYVVVYSFQLIPRLFHHCLQFPYFV